MSEDIINRPLADVLVVLCICLGLAVSARAQVSTADIVGTVTHGSGAALPGASVTVTNTSTSEIHSVASGAGREFTIPTLRIGNYTVKVQHGRILHRNEQRPRSIGNDQELSSLV